MASKTVVFLQGQCQVPRLNPSQIQPAFTEPLSCARCLFRHHGYNSQGRQGPCSYGLHTSWGRDRIRKQVRKFQVVCYMCYEIKKACCTRDKGKVRVVNIRMVRKGLYHEMIWSEWVGGSSYGEFWFQEANGKALIWGLKLYGRRAGTAGAGGRVVQSHCREALFYYGEECEFYYKFCKKSPERFKQKNDVWLSCKRPLWLQHKKWIMGLWRLWWVGPEAGRPVRKLL